MKTSKKIKANKLTTQQKFVVWVGGAEINDSYLTKDEAVNLAKHYERLGYDDVVIESHSSKFFSATTLSTLSH